VTVSQERFWLSHHAGVEGNSADTVLLNFWLEGPVDPEILENSLNSVVERHSSLRTIFVNDMEAGLQQKIIENPPKIKFKMEDFSRYGFPPSSLPILHILSYLPSPSSSHLSPTVLVLAARGSLLDPPSS
jgi:hypothetical protein